MPTPSPNTSATTGESPSAASAGEVVSSARASGNPVAIDAARDSWNSKELLGDRLEVLIVHGEEVYRLRRTRQDKLILYK